MTVPPWEGQVCWAELLSSHRAGTGQEGTGTRRLTKHGELPEVSGLCQDASFRARGKRVVARDRRKSILKILSPAAQGNAKQPSHFGPRPATCQRRDTGSCELLLCTRQQMGSRIQHLPTGCLQLVVNLTGCFLQELGPNPQGHGPPICTWR